MFLADILMIMVICGIFVFRLQIVDTRSELVALTVLLGLGLKSLFIFLFIMFRVQPSLDLQLILLQRHFLLTFSGFGNKNLFQVLPLSSNKSDLYIPRHLELLGSFLL